MDEGMISVVVVDEYRFPESVDFYFNSVEDAAEYIRICIEQGYEVVVKRA